MTRSEFLSRWLQRAEELRRYSALVDGARIVTEFVGELEMLFRTEDTDSVTLVEAAGLSGYSPDHIGRLLREGRLVNVGRKHRPRVRRGDLPRKASSLPEQQQLDIVHRTSKRQIARSVVNSRSGRQHDG